MGDDRCPECLEVYRTGVGCLVERDVLPFGREPDLDLTELLSDPDVDLGDIVCACCSVPWGGIHHVNCTIATCRRCEGQALGHTWRECRANRRRAVRA